MLQAVADFWRPQINRDNVLLAQSCTQCQQAGKHSKTFREFGKLPAADAHNDELATDFAGLFQRAPKTKKYLLVSIDYKTKWPAAAFVAKPTIRKRPKRTYRTIRFSKKNSYGFRNYFPRRSL